jgi:hypothetical protein
MWGLLMKKVFMITVLTAALFGTFADVASREDYQCFSSVRLNFDVKSVVETSVVAIIGTCVWNSMTDASDQYPCSTKATIPWFELYSSRNEWSSNDYLRRYFEVDRQSLKDPLTGVYFRESVALKMQLEVSFQNASEAEKFHSLVPNSRVDDHRYFHFGAPSVTSNKYDPYTQEGNNYALSFLRPLYNFYGLPVEIFCGYVSEFKGN